jgi:hypothetical protein
MELKQVDLEDLVLKMQRENTLYYTFVKDMYLGYLGLTPSGAVIPDGELAYDDLMKGLDKNTALEIKSDIGGGMVWIIIIPHPDTATLEKAIKEHYSGVRSMGTD